MQRATFKLPFFLSFNFIKTKWIQLINDFFYRPINVFKEKGSLKAGYSLSSKSWNK